LYRYTEAVHVSAAKQSKWWFAKRFLHPDVVGLWQLYFTDPQLESAWSLNP
jgi:hypothetical protein